MDFSNFQDALDNAITAVVDLREAAQEIRESMDNIIDACANIEMEL